MSRLKEEYEKKLRDLTQNYEKQIADIKMTLEKEKEYAI
jgi:hypothetical protein